MIIRHLALASPKTASKGYAEGHPTPLPILTTAHTFLADLAVNQGMLGSQ